ncbi:hypothetical protein ACROAE_20500, partial [Shewanella sp. MF05960]|uniref:hypothetical protein n=1 Tax=Shewanella sp. MF05960 TaxID=3434874 RepID=UPI003D7B16B4
IKYKDKEKERYLITLARSIKLFFISLFLKRMYEKRSSMISPCVAGRMPIQVLVQILTYSEIKCGQVY